MQVLQSKKHLKLGRSVYMARVDSRRYFEHLSYDDPLLADLKAKMNELGLFTDPYNFSEHSIRLDEYELFHANPLLAGAYSLDLQCSTALSSGVFMISGQMCLLYTALRQEVVLTEAVPFLEEFIRVFHKYIFSNYSGTPARGQYHNTSCLKFNFSADVPSRIVPSRHRRFNVINSKKQKEFVGTMDIPLSRLAGWLTKKDMSSAVCSAELGLNETLETVEQLCDDELYGSRLLSLNTMKTLRIFNSFCILLERKLPFLSGTTGELQSKQHIAHVGTLAAFINGQVCLTVLNYLDCAERERTNASMNTSCRKIAEEMKTFFSRCDFDKLCTLPPAPLRRRDVFGDTSPGNIRIDINNLPRFMSDFGNDAYHQNMFFANQFESLGNMPPGSKRDNRKKELIESFKEAVVHNPLIPLMILDVSQPFNPAKVLMPSMLDYAIGGSIQDRDLAEWLVQMEGISLRGVKLPRFILGQHDKGLITSQSHLQIACYHRCT